MAHATKRIRSQEAKVAAQRQERLDVLNSMRQRFQKAHTVEYYTHWLTNYWFKAIRPRLLHELIDLAVEDLYRLGVEPSEIRQIIRNIATKADLTASRPWIWELHLNHALRKTLIGEGVGSAPKGARLTAFPALMFGDVRKLPVSRRAEESLGRVRMAIFYIWKYHPEIHLRAESGITASVRVLAEMTGLSATNVHAKIAILLKNGELRRLDNGNYIVTADEDTVSDMITDLEYQLPATEEDLEALDRKRVMNARQRQQFHKSGLAARMYPDPKDIPVPQASGGASPDCDDEVPF